MLKDTCVGLQQVAVRTLSDDVDSWDNLYEGYKKGEIVYTKGNLDRRAVPGTFESFVCVYGDACATDLIDNFFCYVHHELQRKFVSWGPNTVLKFVPMRETQGEILHLRTKVDILEKVVANFTTDISTLEAMVNNITTTP